MSAMKAWFFSIVALLGFVLAIHQLGIDVAGSMRAVVHGVERFLDQPL